MKAWILCVYKEIELLQQQEQKNNGKEFEEQQFIYNLDWEL